MATTFADLEARLRGHDARLQRTEEDVTAIITTVAETRDDVRELRRKTDWLINAVAALLNERGIQVPPIPGEEDEEG